MKKMTKQSRWMIYSSIFISGLLILTAMVYFVSSGSKGNSAAGWFTAVLIVTAILAVVFVFIARNRIKKKAGMLNEEFFTAYEAVADSFEGSVLGRMERKETLNDILGLFLDAQTSGRTVDMVTGGDLPGFIKKVKESFGYRNGFLFAVISGMQYAVMYLFMVQIYEWIRNFSGEGFFDASPGYGMLILLMPIAFVGIPLMRHYIRKQKIIIAMIIPLVIFGIDVAFMEISHANFMHVEFIRRIHEESFSYVPNVWFLILWSGLLGMTIPAKWLMRKASIRKL